MSSTSTANDPGNLKRIPLHALHVQAGARMVPFAGYEMPVQYAAGILKEHLHTRAAAGLFDVSHMGQIALRPRSGKVRDAALALESLVPADIVGLAEGRQRYAFLTNDAGGIRDDLMVANRGDHLLLVVNAACKREDEMHLRQQLDAQCIIEPLREHALLALQGPRAEAVLTAHAPEAAAMRFMDVRVLSLRGIHCVVSRSGYTGEDGFEISVAGAEAEALARMLLQHSSVALAGLGARDSLRLEAGLCLYGSDLDPTTTPVEAALEWAIPPIRRPGGARAGGYPGAERIGRQLVQGAPRRRVGLRPQDRTPVRSGTALFRSEVEEHAVGTVTSGGFGPSVQAPISMGYVERPQAQPGTRLFAEVRGRRVPVVVSELPFVPHGYNRGRQQ
jgi:aminomethyltransferase